MTTLFQTSFPKSQFTPVSSIARIACIFHINPYGLRNGIRPTYLVEILTREWELVRHVIISLPERRCPIRTRRIPCHCYIDRNVISNLGFYISAATQYAMQMGLGKWGVYIKTVAPWKARVAIGIYQYTHFGIS